MPAKTTNALAIIEDMTDDERSDRFAALLAEMNTGKPQAATALLELCEAFPAFWKKIGGLEYSVEHGWLRLMAPGQTPANVFHRETITNELDRRRSAMRKDGDSPLEQLLINRVLSAWLQVMYADMRYSQDMAANGPIVQMEYQQKRLDRAQRQFLRAIQALATVRRLIGPVQVNIGQNQVNVVANGANHP